MFWGACSGQLELRRRGDGSASLRGSFPYRKTATLSDGGRSGRPRKERIESRAFAHNVEADDVEVNLLLGHDFSKPLASKLNRSLRLRDTDEALSFEATIAPEIAESSFGRDALAMISSGLAVGISPGFRIPPRRAVAKAEIITEEPDEGPGSENRGAIIRTILQALLAELSIVTRPAYSEAQVEMRNWEPSANLREVDDAGLRRALNRWRA